MTKGYQIHYKTHPGHHILDSYSPDLAWRIPLKMGRLFQARIQAEARAPDGHIIGEVFKRNGRLTWWCESKEGK